MAHSSSYSLNERELRDGFRRMSVGAYPTGYDVAGTVILSYTYKSNAHEFGDDAKNNLYSRLALRRQRLKHRCVLPITEAMRDLFEYFLEGCCSEAPVCLDLREDVADDPRIAFDGMLY